MPYQRVGLAIRELRERGAAGVDAKGKPITTLLQLADKANDMADQHGIATTIHASWLSNLENKEAEPTPERLQALSLAFGEEPAYLLRVDQGWRLQQQLLAGTTRHLPGYLLGRHSMANFLSSHLKMSQGAKDRMKAVQKMQLQELVEWPGFEEWRSVKGRTFPLEHVLEVPTDEDELAEFADSPWAWALVVEWYWCQPFAPHVPIRSGLRHNERSDALRYITANMGISEVVEAVISAGGKVGGSGDTAWDAAKEVPRPSGPWSQKLDLVGLPDQSVRGVGLLAWTGPSAASGWYLLGEAGPPDAWPTWPPVPQDPQEPHDGKPNWKLSAEDLKWVLAGSVLPGSGPWAKVVWDRYVAKQREAGNEVPAERVFSQEQLAAALVLEEVGKEAARVEIGKVETLVRARSAFLDDQGRTDDAKGLRQHARTSMTGVVNALAMRLESLLEYNDPASEVVKHLKSTKDEADKAKNHLV